jgi:flagellar motility protein MotE (MotC chaperone)
VKPIILYTVIFVLAFILTSFGIIQLNSKFNNIFKFDFSAKSSRVDNKIDQTPSDSTSINKVQKEAVSNKNQTVQDSLQQKQAKSDSLIVASNIADNSKTNLDVNKSNSAVNKNSTVDIKQENQTPTGNLNLIPASQKIDKVDSAYIKWEKKAAGVYESMDPKKAAKIIQNFSDNMARDIIFAMKKNKAADILAELNPAFAARIMRMP